jgi:hypothetical protein
MAGLYVNLDRYDDLRRLIPDLKAHLEGNANIACSLMVVTQQACVLIRGR